MIGLWDQSAGFQPTPIAAALQSDREFFCCVEAALAPHSSVYLLPYRSYPEAGPIAPNEGVRASPGLLAVRWSYGGMTSDNGAAIEQVHCETLGQPVATSADGTVVVFRVQPTGDTPARLTSK